MGETTLLKIIQTILETGVDSLPLILVAIIVVMIWFDRKDKAVVRAEMREDAKAMTRAMERNTAALNRISDISQVRLENNG